MEPTHLKKRAFLVAGLALMAGLSACGETEPSADDLINDASDAAAGVEHATASLSGELRTAAAATGEMPCGLPALPDARASRSVSPDQSTYNTDDTPEKVVAFYSVASEVRSGSAKTSAIPGLSEVELTLGDAATCKVTAQAQPTGDTNVTITAVN